MKTLMAMVLMGAIGLAAGDAAAQGAFDGAWQVTLKCPRDPNGAKGYTRVFPAQVRNGRLDGVYGMQDEPGWMRLTGDIAPGGAAALQVDGIVNNPAGARRRSERGTPYTYAVEANFERSTGAGRRVGERSCNFGFQRQ